MTITLAAIAKSVALTAPLMAVKEFTDDKDAVRWANEQAWRWVRSMRSDDGTFVIDGYPEDEQKDDGSDVPFDFFSSIKDEFIITANGGEELFIIGVDEASLEAVDVPDRTFSSQGVRIFYAPQGVVFDDGEQAPAGWYIQQIAVSSTDGHMPGISDGIGPYDSFDEAVGQIANEFGKWVQPEEGETPLKDVLISTPDTL